jgi:hypothetical protein
LDIILKIRNCRPGGSPSLQIVFAKVDLPGYDFFGSQINYMFAPGR